MNEEKKKAEAEISDEISEDIQVEENDSDLSNQDGASEKGSIEAKEEKPEDEVIDKAPADVEIIEEPIDKCKDSALNLNCDEHQKKICHGSKADSIDSELELSKPKFDLPFIFGASVIGPLHVQIDLPCQDANAYEVLSPEWSVLAVADGLGSAKHSDIGSQTAVKATIDYLRNFISPNGESEPITNTDIELPELAAAAIRHARSEVESVADCHKLDIRKFATTLLVVVIHEREVGAAHIGDGAIVVLDENELKLISDPGDSEYVNEVVPLTTKNPEPHIRKSEVAHDVIAISAFSDGNQRMALSNTPNGPVAFHGFFDPVFKFAREQTIHNDAVQELIKFQKSAKMAEFSEDDKTMVLAVLVR